MNDVHTDALKTTAMGLLAYCRANDWAGYDPYDALNSQLLESMPILRSRIPQVVLTQALKRSPINIRWLALVPKTQNSKAIALFLGAMLKLSKAGLLDDQRLIGDMVQKLVELRSPNTPRWCWGYSFPWQTRTVIVPRGAPNMVCTTFVANALLDAYEQLGDARALEMAHSGAGYILEELYWADGDAAGLSYPLPSLRAQVHNANLLGAALFCRVHRHTGDRKFVEPAMKVARYSAGKQRDDGSWPYGELPTQAWIDNFHTGYNLDALRDINRNMGTSEFERCIRRGFEFYKRHFFCEDGAVRYFHDRTYPIDIHCVAQSIITLTNFKDLDPGNVAQARSVFNWAMKYMWDPRGFFYYRVLRSCTIRTSYMRWSQAWMLLALSTLISDTELTHDRAHLLADGEPLHA